VTGKGGLSVELEELLLSCCCRSATALHILVIIALVLTALALDAHQYCPGHGPYLGSVQHQYSRKVGHLSQL